MFSLPLGVELIKAEIGQESVTHASRFTVENVLRMDVRVPAEANQPHT
ncbi:MAG: hypothetical protein OXC80_07555 [Gammaproteobacteria bacterium]|nr:hypothetical protein [Gammaproteobacteria bacterium]